MDKYEISEILGEIAVLLELKGENVFKSRAYTSAARTLDLLDEDLGTLIAEGRLGSVKGIGSALQDKIAELYKTGKLPYYDELKASLPAGLLELLNIPGVGPKKARALYDKLQIVSLDDLEAACKDGRVASLTGFGEKTATRLLEGIEQYRSYKKQHLYSDAILVAHDLVDALREHPDVIRCSIAGSLRRCKETVKDVDLLASSSAPEEVMGYFCTLQGVERVVNQGPTKASVVLVGGIPCDLRVVSDKEFATALHHFTGSKEHNVAMRQRAIAEGKKLSEWGLFLNPSKTASSDGNENSEKPEGEIIPCCTEEEIFEQLGLQYIPPELRENMGELEAAEQCKIPRLLEWSDLRGTFHNHTTWSDGKNTVREMAEAAQAIGLSYLGISDHSKSSFQANGLSEERLLSQIEEIRKFNRELEDIHLFAGCEVDILKDGRLDYGDDILKQLDFVVASVHNAMQQPEDEMTRRVIRAMENPFVTMLGHPTGRLLLTRQGSAINMAKIIDCAAETGTWIEINASPYRLDMDWRWWHRARDKGVKCSINPDAHRVGQLGFLRLGANVARKGWLRREDVVNTLPLEKIRDLLEAE
jgi:DNA polymerase (family X)